MGPDGSATVAGFTGSSDFPTTSGAYDETHNGSTDAFVAKLSLPGSGSVEPDLIITGLDPNPDEAPPGGSVSVAFSVLNIGQTASMPSQTNLRLGTSPIDVTVDDPLLAEIQVPAVDPGTFLEFQEDVTIPAGLTPGTYYLWAIADVNGTAGQTPEGELNDKVNVAFEVTDCQSTTIQVLEVDHPLLLQFGATHRIEWEADPGQLVDLFLMEDPNADPPTTSNLIQIASDVDGGSFDWLVTDVGFQRTRLLIRDSTNPCGFGTSQHWVLSETEDNWLTKLHGDGTFEPFLPDWHGWQFGNNRESLFPMEWFANDPQFQYMSGQDPFTDRPYEDYGDWYGGLPVVRSMFPDWPSWVRTFGKSQTYSSGSNPMPLLSEANRWAGSAIGHGWVGSCSGLAVSSLAWFADEIRFKQSFEGFDGFSHLNEAGNLSGGFLDPDDRAQDYLRELNNALWYYYEHPIQMAHVDQVRNKTVAESLVDLQSMMTNEGHLNSGYLYFNGHIRRMDGSTTTFAHAVLPFRTEPTDSNEPECLSGVGCVKLYVYDPNWPGDDILYMVLDPMANHWDYATPFFGHDIISSDLLFVMDPVDNYYGFRQLARETDELIVDYVGGSSIKVSTLDGHELSISNDAGETLSYLEGHISNNIEGAYPVIFPVGGPTHPHGYSLPEAVYSINLVSAESTLVTIRDRDISYVYLRTGDADADSLGVTNSVLEVFGGSGSASVSLRGRAGGNAVRFGFDRRSAEDKLRFSFVEEPILDAEMAGETFPYDLYLETQDGDQRRRFAHGEVAIVGGSTHRVLVDWATLGDSDVAIEIDLDSDGVPDDTLFVDNQLPTDIEGSPEGSLPSTTSIESVFPNPAAGTATVRYALAESGNARLRLFDILGREVAVLSNRVETQGRYESEFDVSSLANGVYFIRLEAGNAVVSRQVTVMH